MTFACNSQSSYRCKFGSLRRFSIFVETMRTGTKMRDEPTGTYRIKNWALYSARLIARGDITMQKLAVLRHLNPKR